VTLLVDCSGCLVLNTAEDRLHRQLHSALEQRFVAERLVGLFSRHAGQLPSKLTPALEARILEWSVKRQPSDGSTPWSTRKIAARLGLSHMMVARVAQACFAATSAGRLHGLE
jgi:hypothetical protein